MKKAFTVMISAFAAMALSGCSNGGTQPDSFDSIDLPSDSSQQTFSSKEPESTISNPSGTPTFLIGADGLPIYTSEISGVYTDEWGETSIPVEELDENSFASVICKGFAYVHDSRINVLAAEAPDKFENGVYKGEELPPSTEYRRLRVGDKVGTLTVSGAETRFSRQSEFADKGTWFETSSVWFDGELTITGYISIYENPLYEDGMIRLVPTESTLPQIIYQYADGVGISHTPVLGGGSYTETAEFNLGYLGSVKGDTGGLKSGDTDVKVRAVIGNIRAGGGPAPMYLGELLSVTVL